MKLYNDGNTNTIMYRVYFQTLKVLEEFLSLEKILKIF